MVPLAIHGGYLHYGLPHVVWSYSFTSPRGTMDPFADRIYHSCRFIGPYGVFDRAARNGRCGWFRFFREQDAR